MAFNRVTSRVGRAFGPPQGWLTLMVFPVVLGVQTPNPGPRSLAEVLDAEGVSGLDQIPADIRGLTIGRGNQRLFGLYSDAAEDPIR